ncbi:hypothetical protein RI129_002710 [Pyrocoelia pectoralis]|uniref:Uncharacterized protein n=1 Tax=Pyrocoelia pectoralis TaxID=417401 RepID=A0AAN7VNN1_9COLE
MQSLQEPVAPKADSFRTKKEKEQQQLKNSLNQLTEVAVKAINKLNPTNTHNSHNDGDGPSCSSAMLVFALKQVPSDQQLRCMIDMLRVAEVYRKGGNAIISEEYST